MDSPGVFRFGNLFAVNTWNPDGRNPSDYVKNL